ncbi:MAG: DNA topoisomerase I [Candidatus Aenigmarchaeota archaeon]|nr:DNA topoisomerase I [Candidatus Aenigmarchaeota archaeon]
MSVLAESISGLTVIITEKPDAATRIAGALAERPRKVASRGAYWYEFERGGRKFIVVPAVGHLIALDTVKDKSGWGYPTFATRWIPAYEKKGGEFSERYYRNMQDVLAASPSAEVIVATDYDTEGSVIGYNIISRIAGRADAGRMKFSTLTKDELVEAFEKRDEALDMGQVESGLTRHYLDFYWGINMTRALTTAAKHANEHGFALLSTGRVQGPTLAMLFDRELEIRAFVPKPFWQVDAGLENDGRAFTASYGRGSIWDEDEAKKIRDECSRAGTRAIVTIVEKRKYSQAPPVPFNTTDLQAESYEHFHYSPKQTLGIVEELYQAGAVSYPRSSSQKLPPAIGYKKIISALSKLSAYKTLANALAKRKELIPNEGSKTDPAHPAIYPTAETPDTRKLSTAQKNLYDMIVRRFMAVFAEAALREATTATFDIAGHEFKATGHTTLEQGWAKFAGKYASLEEDTLPDLKEGEQLLVKTIALLAKKTQPPARFTQASVLRAMEDKELGTRATRAEILQTLYDRNYITGRTIEVTKLGEAVTSVLKDYSPRIVSEELTRKFEEEMEAVQSGGKKRDEVLEEAKNILTELLAGFKQNEPEIGQKLLAGVQQARDEERAFGKCPNCGSDLRVIVSKATGKRFVGCSNYPKCSTSFPLPQKGALRKAGATCKCGLPMILIFGRGRRPYRACINPSCRGKESSAR